MKLPIAMAAAVLVASTAPAQVPAQAAVEDAMAESAAGWNAGQLDRFMAIYDDQAIYVSGSGEAPIVRGKAAIAARYAPRFAGQAAARRGTLSFTTLHFRSIAPGQALLIARYRLRHADGRSDSGPTTLLFRLTRSGWRIVADHSS